jgi:ABC-2 type transporter
MTIRFIINEVLELLAKPLLWAGICLASAFVLVALGQIDLDSNKATILILDSSNGQEEGRRIAALVGEIEGIIPVIASPANDVMGLVDHYNPSIILNHADGRWQATLRSRSIIDHRRLARLGLMLATVINRQTPWDAVAGTDVFTAADQKNTVCQIGARICAAYRWIGDPRMSELCSMPVKPLSNDPRKQSTDEKCGVDSIALKQALAFAGAIDEFCKSEMIQPDQKSGICPADPNSSLIAVVGLSGDPQPHVRVFIPRTVALIVIFIAFVMGCRSIMIEARYGIFNSLIAMNHGRIANLVFAKATVSVLYCLVLLLLLLIFSQISFGLYIKPGLTLALMPMLVAIGCSAGLGMSISLFVRDEASVYLVGCVYLLLLFVLSGYIDDIRADSTIIWAITYFVPLRFVLTDFSGWMLFGTKPAIDSVGPLVAQSLGAFIFLVLAIRYYRISS